ncbi:prolyl 3-hydroxylase sudestada1 isoform X1 [Stomoxys calcitrans]|uniref:uS12 prolyl 3-hydroxylase n=1 Tax=Stomoxys calcitrans TaxID=35570 RepID=A0A1I8PF04_STOCA|nr:prolyl 3-hydroxylase sudestada1 isoform X1 [Stomoxys calcitrans]
MDTAKGENKSPHNHNKDDATEGGGGAVGGCDANSCTNGHTIAEAIQDGPQPAKISKLQETQEPQTIDLSLNQCYTSEDYATKLQKQWFSDQSEDYKDSDTNVEVYNDPFQICLLPGLLKNKESCKLLMEEMVKKVHWSRKQMDLYEFYQSTDLSNMIECKFLANFLQMLRRSVRPWLERVTNLKLDYVSASCSMYTCGDYLLVHDDLLKDRQVAFIYYLSPWEGNEEWQDEHGGCLEIFSSDEKCLPRFPVQRKISPKNNQFAFFKVGSKSFHQVGEVTTFDYPRLTINGWFHGASNEDLIADALRPFSKLKFKPPIAVSAECSVNRLLNEVYLKPTTKRSIQKRIEDNSEICLYEFFRREIFEEALKQLLTDDKLLWSRKGPANAQNFEILDLKTTSKTLAQIIELFSNTEMFSLLRDYTDLDLSGDNATNPMFTLEIQRWSHGDYTVLGDGAICDDNTLDLIYYLNAAEGAAVITYLSPDTDGAAANAYPTQKSAADDQSDTDSLEGEGFDDDDESVLLTISPVDNALNIVYRCEGTTKFTKYVSRNTPLDKGPVFVISCSYKE